MVPTHLPDPIKAMRLIHKGGGVGGGVGWGGVKGFILPRATWVKGPSPLSCMHAQQCHVSFPCI